MSETKTIPELIRDELKNAKVSQAGLARDLNVTDAHVHMVIEGKSPSHRVRAHISNVIGIPESELWPDSYVEGKPKRPGRPRTHGFFDHHAA